MFTVDLNGTVRMRRGGSYLHVPQDSVERYISKGYDVVDEDGNVIRGGNPNDVHSLKTAYDKALERIKELEEEVAQLKATDEKPKAPAKKKA